MYWRVWLTSLTLDSVPANTAKMFNLCRCGRDKGRHRKADVAKMAESPGKLRGKKDKRMSSKDRASSKDESGSPKIRSSRETKQQSKQLVTSPKHKKQGKKTEGSVDMGIKNMEIVGDDVVVQTVEVLKRPGQSLGFYIREGNGMDRNDGVFISRIAPGSIVEKNGLLRIGDEIVTVNTVSVTKMNLDDVVVLMSIPKKLVLTIRTRNYSRSMWNVASLEPEPQEKPVVVLKQGSMETTMDTADYDDNACPDEFILAGREAREAYSRQAAQGMGLPEGLKQSRSKALQRHVAIEQVEKEDSNDSGLSSETSASFKDRDGQPHQKDLDDLTPKDEKPSEIQQHEHTQTSGRRESDSAITKSPRHSKSEHSLLIRKKSEEFTSSPSQRSNIGRQNSLEYTSPKKNRILSPDSYNSDSEIWSYRHDHLDADPTRSNSLPKINVGSAEEVQQWVKKFNTLSNELQDSYEHFGATALPIQKPGTSAAPLYCVPSDSDSFTSDEYRRYISSMSPLALGNLQQVKGERTLHKVVTDPALLQDMYQLDNSFEMRREQNYSVMQSVSRGQKVANYSTGYGYSGQVDPRKNVQLCTRLQDLQLGRKPLRIRVEDFSLYRPEVERKSLQLTPSNSVGLDGLLSVHLYCGHGLKSSKTVLRDLYCVFEVNGIRKARTMIRTGAMNFDWDEAFDIDLEEAFELACLVYSWDPSTRHRLCFSGIISLPNIMSKCKCPTCKIALKMEPKGLLYLELSYKEPATSLHRMPSMRKNALFGADLETVIKREKSKIKVPILIQKCVEEIESRGLEVIGLYRLCGSARKKAQLREEMERNVLNVDLSTEQDINVITGVLKDYLRELPEPLFTNALYNMLIDALRVQMPGDPEGNAKLMLSILECLPKSNQETMVFLLDHLKKVASKSDANKMSLKNLAICFGPVLLCPSPSSVTNTKAALDFKKHIEVLAYLLKIWPEDRGTPSVTPDEEQSSDALSRKLSHSSQKEREGAKS